MHPINNSVVQVWSTSLIGSAKTINACQKILAEDEMARAKGFNYSQHQQQFILTHGVLRGLLAYYLGGSPSTIQFTYGEKKKPRVGFPATNLQFNLSHSGTLVVYAFASNLELGVDVEQVHTGIEVCDLAKRFFCAEEADELGRLSGGDRQHAFFLCWTRKEAYTKAIGNGLFLPLDSFQVTLLPCIPARFVHLGGDHHAAAKWMLCNLPVAPGYAAALAYQGPEREIQMIHLGTADDALAYLGFDGLSL